MMNYFMVLLMIISILFINLRHPVSMGVVLLLHTVMVGGMTGSISSVFWLSYVLFLVFLGGVLVLFIYMTSLASNEKFELSWGSILWVGVAGGVALILAIFMYILPAYDVVGMLDNSSKLKMIGVSANQYIFKFYGEYTSFITFYLVFYLLYALLVCVNIVGFKYGALRKFS